MQPLFEAISNAIHSTQDKFGDKIATLGRIVLTVNTNRKKDDLWVTVEDNGRGLDEDNWDAFTTTDTDNKIEMGGKGVGRLMWLDCFEKISVDSVFREQDQTLKRRSFRFRLTQENQFEEDDVVDATDVSDTSFFVKFTGVKDNGYYEWFPGRGDYVFQHLTSHFLPTFIGGRCPQISVTVGDDTRQYPSAISEIAHEKIVKTPDTTEEYGNLTLTLMKCDKVASADLKGKHFIHFIAHDRTVHSQKIDAKLGLGYFGDDNDRVLHAIVTGTFLDENVNQERTTFVFEAAVVEKIINDVCTPYINEFLAESLAELSTEQRGKIEVHKACAAAFGITANRGGALVRRLAELPEQLVRARFGLGSRHGNQDTYEGNNCSVHSGPGSPSGFTQNSRISPKRNSPISGETPSRGDPVNQVASPIRAGARNAVALPESA